MPTFTDPSSLGGRGKRIPYCTEAELLEFANKVRQAGGAAILEAFMPSKPEDPDECLIANALNFKCRVQSWYPEYNHWNDSGYGDLPPELVSRYEKSNENHPDESIWGMNLPQNISHKRAQAVADAVGCPYVKRDRAIILPREIGNAAHAFDVATRGWVTKYRENPDEIKEI